ADFINNTASSGSGQGGAVWVNPSNSVNINTMKANFIGNKATLYGGALSAGGTVIGNIVGDFIMNYATRDGGAIYNRLNSTIGNITGNFIGNILKGSGSVNSRGSAIYNDSSTIGNITGDFIGNSITSSSSASGGAIYNYNSGSIGNITGDFIGNSVTSESSTASSVYGGAISNRTSTIGNITGDFIGNSATTSGADAYGGAIYNYKSTINSIIDATFVDNSVSTSKARTPKGGAIYNDYYGGNSELNLFAQNKDVLFYNNTVTKGGVTTYNDIYQGKNTSTSTTTATGTINLNATEGRKISFGGTIEGDIGFASNQILNLNSADYAGGTYEFNNAVMNHTINLGAAGLTNPVTMRLGGIVQANGSKTYGSLDTTDILTNYVNDSVLDTRNAHTDANALDTINLGSNVLKYMLDAHLFGEYSDSDTLDANTVTGEDGKISLDTINLGNLAKKIEVQLTETDALKEKIELATDYKLEGTMANFVDKVSYDKETGVLSFTTKTPSGGGADDSILGTIHGLVSREGNGTYHYHPKTDAEYSRDWTNLAVGTTMEQHLRALDNAIGNRKGTRIVADGHTTNTSVSDQLGELSKLIGGAENGLNPAKNEALMADGNVIKAYATKTA
ncbi:MAG: hypothetical protein J6N45_04775, partial [Alphaproteobacteria bacterium]|nr:hypothetical protein [Alphaproteobacteria bacterium]